ncbi:hypothetical protein [Raineyella fluvialis]|uniref:Uncharacterized protein n=1 Tax=Raineyella fluvialis TaxID=2662261 RepID=A0A5Q2FDQ6_9ACTN|nr:hypothetical protein [Raineyella fluvialis]QGF23574.1 hypothetical protein Rai3103_07740 [Raineyella fluvialis]
MASSPVPAPAEHGSPKGGLPPDPAEILVTIEHPDRPRGPQGGHRPAYGSPARTHLPDDTVLSWLPADLTGIDRYAIDAEYADRPLPAALTRRFGDQDFWTRWTRAEVCAKLTDTPILLWIDLHGLPADPAAGTPLRVHTLDRTAPDGRTIRVSTGTAGPPSPGSLTG